MTHITVLYNNVKYEIKYRNIKTLGIFYIFILKLVFKKMSDFLIIVFNFIIFFNHILQQLLQLHV